jgi:uncharacterized protein (TIGR02722 family)
MRILRLFAFAPFIALLAGCAEHAVYRGSQEPGIDTVAMSTSLDKDDIKTALQKLLNQMRVSPVMDKWRQDGGNDVVAIAPFTNETSEHIDSALDMMLSDTETWLANSSVCKMIDHSRQLAMIQEVEGQQHPVFNPNHIAQYGQQLGAQFFITGKVAATDEMTEDARRVQYSVYLQVIDVSTSQILFQKSAEISKMVT